MAWDYDKLRQAVLRYKSDKYSWKNLRPPLSELKRAAVLIPLFIKDGEVHVWLTKRSQLVGSDKGHVSFPGGMRDPDDSDEMATCLREANEEVGLQNHNVEVIARYIPRINARKIFITPIVGFIKGNFIPKPNDEVEIVFHLPLRRFLSKENHHFESFKYNDYMTYLHFFNDEAQGENVSTWGLTAMMCIELAVAVYQQETEFDITEGSRLSPQNPYVYQLQLLKKIEQPDAPLHKL